MNAAPLFLSVRLSMVAASLPFQSVCEEDLDTDLSWHVHVVDLC